MAGGSRPEPVTRYQWASTDPEAANQYLRDTYTDFRPEKTDAAGFTFWTEVATTDLFGIGRLRHSGPVRARCAPPSALVVVQNLAGGPHHVDDGSGFVGGTLKLTPTWSDYDTGWQDVTVQTAVLDHDEVSRIGAELSGLEPEAVTFTSAAPVSLALADHWSRLCTHVHDDVLSADALMGAPLVRANTMRHLATTLISTFPNTALEVLIDPATGSAGHAEPATVRRAVEFMDSHAGDDIGLTEIADAARIGARSLQLAFRRHRDITPLEYLRRVRLESAHRDLLAGDPTRGDRVEAIAARWGFGHPGRFSVIYREAYGRSPSATLRH
ncbi:helix-turn-helix protein [Actinomycetospora succinea]|uniref:Helix-turn-helix protein n=1 Tax=Actinomycetospora succinea TaxID=663603 RepID=A0A4R6VD65_9PSEU|nr:helix-turn-helix transcriptional regulator [Actinomycetospora succinea]TDQ58654.1 helix-turn-helix protein [Actinomycetospora succinea]